MWSLLHSSLDTSAIACPARGSASDGADPEARSPMASDKRKQSLYFPEDYLEEIRQESIRLDRSMSWLVQKAWEISRDTIRGFPSTNEYLQNELNEQEDEE